MNYRIWYFYTHFWQNLKDLLYFLFCLPLIIIPPLWIAAFLIGARPASSREGNTRQTKLFALFPERVNGQVIWLKTFSITEIYCEVGRGMGCREMGWRKQKNPRRGAKGRRGDE